MGQRSRRSCNERHRPVLDVHVTSSARTLATHPQKYFTIHTIPHQNEMNHPPNFWLQKWPPISPYHKSQLSSSKNSISFLPQSLHTPPMAKPTNNLRILAPSHDPVSSSSSSSSSMANHSKSQSSKLDSAIALSNHIPFSTMLSSRRPKNSNPPPPASSLLKSKPHLQKSASGGDEKLSKMCKDLGANKFFDEKKEANDDGKELHLVVKDKELKEAQKGHRLHNLRPTISLLRKGGRRNSFPVSQMDLGDILAKNGVKVISVDMPPALQIHAVDCARKTHDSMEKFTSKTLALSLKRVISLRVYHV